MKKSIAIAIVLFTSYSLSAQLLIDSIPFPNLNVNFWGLGEKGDTLLLGDDFNGPISFLTKDGAIHRTLTTPYTFNHGTVWTGTHYLVAEDFTNSGAGLFELDENGVETNSWTFPAVIGGNSSGIGGLHYDNGSVWYTMYFPDFNTYPFSYAYKWTPGQASTIDTIPLRGEQPYGITFKGDTLLYVTDNLNGDVEKIYAYHESINDTIFSFDIPDTPIDNDMSPRGLHYDGKHLWMLADRQGGSAFSYRTLYKFGIEPYGFMDIDNQELHFGDVNLTASSTMSFNITNNGQQDLNIESITGSLASFDVTSPTFPQAIQPGNTLEVEITFAPTTVGFQDDLLTISSNDIINEEQNVLVTGIGVDATGVEDLNHNHFSIKPNPTLGLIQVELTEKLTNELITLEIIDLTGKVVQVVFIRQRSSQIQLKVFQSGIYLARLFRNDQLIASQKLNILQ